MEDLYISILSSVIICGLISLALSLYKNNQWIKLQTQRFKLRKQGIKGPKPSLFNGNEAEMERIKSMVPKAKASANGEFVRQDYTTIAFPWFEQWRKEYGPMYTYSTANKQHLYVYKFDLVREQIQRMTLDVGKPNYITETLGPILGEGLLRANGTYWARQRKIVSPALFMDKVKPMVGLMNEAIQPMLKKWEACIESQGGIQAEMEVDDDLMETSANMISKACLGSSYSKGKEIISKQWMLKELIGKQNFLFKKTGMRLLKNEIQTKVKKLENEIETLIWEAVQECSKKCCPEKDLLLQWILDGAKNDQDLDQNSSKKLIFDVCKNIFFGGHESTAVTATWCLLLLAVYPEWQDRIRDELYQHCEDGNPDAEFLTKMKSVSMVIHEVIRLFPPGAFFLREALEDIQLGNIVVPKGVCMWTLIPTLHRDPELWGEDANEFKPERFANGVSNACKIPQFYIPFGVGPRVCVGKNLATVELKLLLCLIVSKFSFSLSPKYEHSPCYRMIIVPGNGVRIVIKRI